MKELVLLISLIICSSCAFSQIDKGRWLVGGNASFSHIKVNTRYQNNFSFKTTVWQLSPGAGYFFADKLAAGVRVNFRFSDYHTSQGIDYDQQISLSPFLRYYFLPKSEKVNLFADAGFLYGISKFRYKDPSSVGGSYTMTNKMSGYSIAAGPVIFLNNKIALELAVSLTKNGDLSYYYYGRSTIIMGCVGFQAHL